MGIEVIRGGFGSKHGAKATTFTFRTQNHSSKTESFTVKSISPQQSSNVTKLVITALENQIISVSEVSAMFRIIKKQLNNKDYSLTKKNVNKAIKRLEELK